MGIGILVGYLVFGVLVGLHAGYDGTSHRAGRGRYTKGTDGVVLWAVGLLAGLLWIAFVPIYLTGWLRSTLAARQRRSTPGVGLYPLERGSTVSTARG